MTNKTNIENNFETWSQNDSLNKSGLDINKRKNGDENKLDSKMKESRKVSPKVYKEINWKKKREINFVKYMKLDQRQYQKDIKNLPKN